MADQRDNNRQQFDDNALLPYQIVLQNDEEVIGRSSECSVNIRSVMVSRRHAVFRRIEGKWYILDDGSMNGVYINDRKADPYLPHMLRDSDIVSLGPPLRTRFVFRFTLGDPETAATQQGHRTNRAGTVANRAFLVMVYQHVDLATTVNAEDLSPEYVTDVKQEQRDASEPAHNANGEASPKKTSCPKKMRLSQSDHVVSKVKDVMENELTCAICCELFVEASVLQCGHTFCSYCITSWRRQRDTCPLCQAKVASATRSFVVDNVIEGLVSFSPTLKQKRETLVRARMEAT